MSVIVKTHTLTQVSQNIANNTSQVRYLVQLQTTGGSYNSNNITTTYYIDGVRYTNTHKLPKTTTTTVVDRTVTITHNADGTRSVSANFSTPTQISAGTITGSKTLTLSTIPRASDLIVSDGNVGMPLSIGVGRYDNSFTTTLQYKVNGQNSWTTIVDKSTNTNNIWNIPTSVYDYMPTNQDYVNCEIKAITYSGNTSIGETTKTIKLYANDNPIINSSSAVDVNSTTTALTGNSSVIVSGVSNVQVTVNASGQYNATISSIKVNGSSATLSGTNPKTGTITFNKATTNKFEIEVIDSRGLKVTTTITKTLLNYVPLTINATIKRNQPTDEKVNISFNGNYFNGSFGSQSNSLTVQYRYKESSSSTWGSWTSLSKTTSGNSYSGSTQLSDMDYTKIYNFEIRATDKVGTKSITGITVSKGEPVYWWDDDSFNFISKFYHKNGHEDVSSSGFIYDQYGNMKAKTSSTSNHWHMDDKDGNKVISIYPINKTALLNGKSFDLTTFRIETDPSSSFQTTFFGSNNSNGRIKPFRLGSSNIDGFAGGYGSGIAVSTADTHMYLHVYHNGARAYIGGGSSNEITWYRKLVLEETTTGTGIVSRSSGATLNSSSYARHGNVVTLNIEISTTSSTSAGNDVFVGTISNNTYIPKVGANGSAYNGSVGILGYINSSGNITLRVIGASLSSGKTINVVFTYVI